MKYGIREHGSTIYCANCGRIISETGSYSDKYCKECGNPLIQDAIINSEIRENDLKENFTNLIKELSRKLETDSLTIVLERLEKEDE